MRAYHARHINSDIVRRHIDNEKNCLFVSADDYLLRLLRICLNNMILIYNNDALHLISLSN